MDDFEECSSRNNTCYTLYSSCSFNNDINDVDSYELPIRVYVLGDSEEDTSSSETSVVTGVGLYSFSTNITGYVRYMTEIENVDMYGEKALYTFVYILLAWINLALVIIMFVRMIALWILAIIGPVLAVLYAIDLKDSFPMNYRTWVNLYVAFSLIQTILAIIYRVILATAI